MLGAAAGGGFPQWNANSEACRRARDGDPAAPPATQASIAITADGKRWFLVNASPDLRSQIEASPCLHPSEGIRSSPIAGVVLTNADVDAVAGLLGMREGQPFTVYGTERVLGVLAANSIFDVLDANVVKRVPMEYGRPFAVEGPSDPVGITVEAFGVPGKIPLYLEEARAGVGLGTQEGDTAGLKVTETATGRHFFFIPGCAKLDDGLRARITGAPLLFFDGTLYTNDEMIVQGLLNKTGERIGHMNMSGSAGSVAQIAPLNIGRKIFIHINNSNPALRDASPERAAVEHAGWEIAYDGMEVRV